MLVSQDHWGLLDYLLDGCIGLTSDGEGGPTSGGGLGMPRIVAVWGCHIDGEGTIVAESLDRSEEHTSELQSHSDLHSFPTRRSSDLRRWPNQRRGAWDA